MLVVVVALFAVCWLPLHGFMLVIDFNPHLTDYKTSAQRRFFYALYYCVHWLAMSNSFVNPIIYGFLNDCFRVSRLDASWQASPHHSRQSKTPSALCEEYPTEYKNSVLEEICYA